MTSADAAEGHPWAAYYPKVGVTCKSRIYDWNGDLTKTEKTTVVSKTKTQVVTRTAGKANVKRLLAGGRLQQTVSATSSSDGVRARIESTVTYPAPDRLLHHQAGSGKVTMTMTLSPQFASQLLLSGRTLVATATYRMPGLGSRTIKLDDEVTEVDALGVRTMLQSVRVTNVKPAYVSRMRRELRSIFAELNSTTWVAKGRGAVRVISRDDDGYLQTEYQVGCS